MALTAVAALFGLVSSLCPWPVCGLRVQLSMRYARHVLVCNSAGHQDAWHGQRVLPVVLQSVAAVSLLDGEAASLARMEAENMALADEVMRRLGLKLKPGARLVQLPAVMEHSPFVALCLSHFIKDHFKHPLHSPKFALLAKAGTVAVTRHASCSNWPCCAEQRSLDDNVPFPGRPPVLVPGRGATARRAAQAAHVPRS